MKYVLILAILFSTNVWAQTYTVEDKQKQEFKVTENIQRETKYTIQQLQDLIKVADQNIAQAQANKAKYQALLTEGQKLDYND